MTDPIRARLDWLDRGGLKSLPENDALRAVLDECAEWGEYHHMSLAIRRVIAEHLGVTE